jgi:hydroxymethylpyrimidine pyrophosphatase-like HAD family hydrolase
MDEFLEHNKSFLRLLADYKKYNSLTIGVDFDGTLYDYHDTGATYEQVRQLVRDLKTINCKIVIWTANKDLDFVRNFCTDNNIPFDGINEGGIPLKWESKKPFFSALLDDRAGLIQVYQELDLLIKIIKKWDLK